MYEELYQPLPDVAAYLRRLQLERPERADKAYLEQLIYEHQCRIPFENLDVCEKRLPISLAVADLFDKVIVRGRGGYCFELNALFLRLVQALGYDACSCRCRIVRGKDYLPPVLHQALLVRFEDEMYFCDVGYGGPQPGGIVPVEDGRETVCAGQTFRVSKHDEYWWLLSYKSDSHWTDILQFTVMPQDAVEFVVTSHYCSTHPDSVFVKQRMLNRRIEGGSMSLVGDIFARTQGGVRTEEQVTDERRYRQLLKEAFGIVVT